MNKVFATSLRAPKISKLFAIVLIVVLAFGASPTTLAEPAWAQDRDPNSDVWHLESSEDSTSDESSKPKAAKESDAPQKQEPSKSASSEDAGGSTGKATEKEAERTSDGAKEKSRKEQKADSADELTSRRSAANNAALPANINGWEYECGTLSRNGSWSFPVKPSQQLPADVLEVTYFEVRMPKSNTRQMPDMSKVVMHPVVDPGGTTVYPEVSAGQFDDGAERVLRFDFPQPMPAEFFSNKTMKITFDATLYGTGAIVCNNQRPRADEIMANASGHFGWNAKTSPDQSAWNEDEIYGQTATVKVKVTQMRNADGYVNAEGAKLRLRKADNPAVKEDPYWYSRLGAGGRPPHDNHWGTPGTPIVKPWASCVADSDGYCTFKVPAPHRDLGAKSDLYWIEPTSAPEGYNVIDELRVGFSGPSTGRGDLGSSHALDYAYRTPELFAGDVVRSGDGDRENGFMTHYGNFSNGYGADITSYGQGIKYPRSSSGHLTFSADNPPLPDQCGINVALVLDTSGSMGAYYFGGKTTSERALQGIYDFAGSLRNSGVNLSFRTFSNDVGTENRGNQIREPILMDDNGVEKLQSIVGNPRAGQRTKITFGGATNWDAALRDLAEWNVQNPQRAHDLVIVVTDGNPTLTTVKDQEGPGNAGDFTMAENTTMSSNWLKSTGDGTRVIGVGVGAFQKGGIKGGTTDKTLSESNFNAVFGSNGTTQPVPTPDDLAQKDWLIFDGENEDNLAQAITKIALAGCEASVVVEKETQVNDGPVQPGGKDWHFDASGLALGFSFADNANQSTLGKKTGENSQVEYRLALDEPSRKNGTITIAEDLSAGPDPNGGWDIKQREGKNAVCVDTAQKNNPPVQVVNDGKYGFKVSGLSSESRIHCKVLNAKKTPDFRVEKAVVKDDGSTFPADTTGDPIMVNPDGTAEVKYRVTVTNSGTVPGRHPKIEDTITVPEGFQVTGVKLDGNTVQLGAGTAGSAGTFTIPAGTADLQPVPQGGTPGASNQASYEVTLAVKAADLEAVDWSAAGQCDTEGAGNPAAGGLFNLVTMEKDTDGPDNNDACVPVTPPSDVFVELIKVAADDKEQTLDGAEFSIFPSDPQGVLGNNGVEFTDGKFKLEPGTYGIVETQAPEGYSLLAAPVYFKVTAGPDGYVMTLMKKNDQGTLVEAGVKLDLVDLLTAAGQPADESSATVAPDSSGVFRIRIADVTTGDLPLTGDSGIMPIVLLAAFLAALAVITARRRTLA